MSVSALAVRPNDASRFGQGGLSAKALQEWFDKLPNLVKEKFNEIAQTLASAEAAKYIGTDALGVDNLYDFLLLFGPRGTGLNDKNISDHIETLYTPEHSDTDDDPTASMTLKDIIADITARIVENTRVSRDAINYVDVTINEYGDLVTDYYTEGYGGNFVVHEFVLLSKNIGDGTITTEKLDQALNERIKAAFKDVSYIASTGQLVFKREADGNIVIDLPLELIVTSGRFDTNKNEIVLVLANGNEIRIPLDAVIGKITSDIEALKDSVKTVRLEGDRLVFESHRGARNDIDLSSFAFDTASREKLDDLGRRVTNIEEHISDDYFVTDNSVAYNKAVPARACSSAKLASFGGMSHKSKNLLDSTKIDFVGNATVTNGVATQTKADTNPSPYMKCLTFDENDFVAQTIAGTIQIGRLGVAFEKTSEIKSIRFGLNGSTVDTMVGTDVAHLPNGTYYLSVNFTNITQGSISWRDMMINEGSTALPYEPYYEGLRDSKVTEIKSYGGNILDGSKFVEGAFSLKGITLSYDADTQIYAINGTVDSSGNFSQTRINLKGQKGSTYIIRTEVVSGSATIPSGAYALIYFGSSDSITDGYTNWHECGLATSQVKSKVLPREYISNVWFYFSQGVVFNNLKVKIMLAETTDPTLPYKPYREPISYPIPAAIQAINGYGKDGFVIDLEKQTSAYEGRVSPLPVPLNPIIEVEGGGRLEFVNEYKNPVPSAVKYLLKEESAV